MFFFAAISTPKCPLLTSKEEIWSWVDRKNVPYVTDPSNFDEKYMRSLIRKNIVPEALRVNPGLRKVMKKKVLKEYESKERETC